VVKILQSRKELGSEPNVEMAEPVIPYIPLARTAAIMKHTHHEDAILMLIPVVSPSDADTVATDCRSDMQCHSIHSSPSPSLLSIGL